MKKTYLLVSLTLISLVTYAQKFETNVAISESATSGDLKMSSHKIALGFSLGIQEFYKISDKVAFGTELNYAYKDYNLNQDYKGISIPESNSYYESGVIIQSLNMPLIFRYTTSKNWTFQTGLGMSYILDSKTDVEYVYSDWAGGTNTRTTINDKSNDLGKNFNSFANIGFGRTFKVFGQEANVQVFYEIALQSYHFSHAGIADEAVYEYNVQPHQLGFKLALRLI